jgi:hypothetical protein
MSTSRARSPSNSNARLDTSSPPLTLLNTALHSATLSGVFMSSDWTSLESIRHIRDHLFPSRSGPGFPAFIEMTTEKGVDYTAGGYLRVGNAGTREGDEGALPTVQATWQNYLPEWSVVAKMLREHQR